MSVRIELICLRKMTYAVTCFFKGQFWLKFSAWIFATVSRLQLVFRVPIVQLKYYTSLLSWTESLRFYFDRIHGISWLNNSVSINHCQNWLGEGYFSTCTAPIYLRSFYFLLPFYNSLEVSFIWYVQDVSRELIFLKKQYLIINQSVFNAFLLEDFKLVLVFCW